jgi:hypothetical protein
LLRGADTDEDGPIAIIVNVDLDQTIRVYAMGSDQTELLFEVRIGDIL